MRRLTSLLLLVLLIPAGFAADATELAVDAQKAKGVPVIDGALDDACWQELTLTNNFRDPLTGEAAQTQTYFRVIYDNKALYFAFTCPEPDMQSLAAKLDSHDDTLWTDDCVELLIDPSNRRQDYAHIIVNPNGAVYDAWVTNAGASSDTEFETGAQAAAQRNEDSWQVELRLPYVGLKLPRDTRPTWAMNVCREKKTAPSELSCWAPPMAEGFHHPEKFGLLKGLKVNFRAQRIDVGVPEFRNPYFEEGKLFGQLAIPYTNDTGRTVAVRVKATFTDPEGLKSETDAVANLGKGRRELLIPVSAEPCPSADLTLEISRRKPQETLSLTQHLVALDFQPVDITFTRPAYRDTIYASLPSSEIICDVKVNLPRKELRGVELRASFNVGETELAVRRVKRLRARGETTIAFASDSVPAGEYSVRAQAIKDGLVIAEGSRALRKLKPQPHEVILGEGGQLLVDGDPFYPCGFMGASATERLSKAGFNAIHTYVAWYIHRDKDLNAWLDEAQQLGIRVIMEPYPGAVGFHGFRGRAKVTDEDLADIREFVNQYKSHPALLAWYLCDEPRGGEWRGSLKRVYETVADADPFHPVVALDNSASTLAKLQNSADILWIDPYPGFARDGGPKKPLSIVRQAIQDTQAQIPEDMPLWVAPQAFSYAEWDKAREATERAPNMTEIRCMHYMSLVSGADGIIPFAWAYAQRHPSTLNTYLDNIGPEMAFLTPIILHGEVLEGARVLTRKRDDLQIKAWRHEGAVYVIVVNTVPEEKQVRVVVPGLGAGWVKILAEDRRIQALDNVIVDTLAPYAVRIYTDKRPLATGTPLSVIERRIQNDEAVQETTW